MTGFPDRSHSDGESLLGDLFQVAFDNRSRYDLDRRDASPWLYGIAAKMVMKHLRTTARYHGALVRVASQAESSPLPVDERVATGLANAQLWSEITAAISELPDGDREVVLLYAWQELSYAEIAEALGIPLGTVRSRLNRTRTVLRAIRAESEREPELRPPLSNEGGIG